VSVTDIAARIQQIQSQIAALAPSTPTATDGTAFANALAGASGSLATDATSSGVTAKSPGQAVVAEARKYLGVPYVWGGTDPKRGLDCSGLVQLVYKKFGVELPRVSYQQARAGTAVDGLANAKPGDILAFGSPVHHVAIYIGDNKMIEAPRPGKDVRVSSVYETPTAIRRVLPDTPLTSAAGATGAAAAVGSGTPYASVFTGAAQRYGVPASLLAAVAHQESGFNASAVSPVGARGLMQLMPATAKGLGVDPMNPTQAVDGAARMLKSLISEFGRVDYALAAYNAGPGAVHRYHGIPPYAETQRYVPAVLAYQKRLAA
jgi:peptidoglycan DL-endopeptidase CwlO